MQFTPREKVVNCVKQKGHAKEEIWERGGLFMIRRREGEGGVVNFLQGGSNLGMVITENNVTHNTVLVRVITKDNIS